MDLGYYICLCIIAAAIGINSVILQMNIQRLSDKIDRLEKRLKEQK